jgi:hypothetical protein
VHDKLLKQTSLDLVEKTTADQAGVYPTDMRLTKEMFAQNVEFMTKFGANVRGVKFSDVMLVQATFKNRM